MKSEKITAGPFSETVDVLPTIADVHQVIEIIRQTPIKDLAAAAAKIKTLYPVPTCGLRPNIPNLHLGRSGVSSPKIHAIYRAANNSVVRKSIGRRPIVAAWGWLLELHALLTLNVTLTSQS